MEDKELMLVSVVSLVEDPVNGGPIVVLHDQPSNRLLPIWIGEPEARAISVALNHMKIPRPLTHTLILSVIEKMGGRLARIEVDRLKNHTYFASLVLQIKEGIISVDARPSDAIALALEARAPLFVARSVMDEAGQKNPFPEVSLRQEKREMNQEDVKKLKELFEKAREREQKSGN